MIKKYQNFLNEEVGLKNISKISKLYKTAEIYFHKDLDGVTSAVAMKEFLKNYYQIETVDCHIIQYGGLEYAIKHHKEGNLCVLVDFAHGKPMFHIATDHHDKQSGAENTQSTYFKSTRSNVETISGEISYADIFTHEDIELIKTVDSADFLANDIKPEDVQNAIFSPDKSVSASKNRFMMGFVVNRLLLAYKNKRITTKSLDGKRNHINRNILECLTLDSTGSLYSMFNNLKNYINNAKTTDKLGRLATPEEITSNLNDYIGRMKNYSFIEDPNTGDVSEYDPTNWRHKKMLDTGAQIGKGVHFDEDYKIVTQYGGGSMIKPGSYDRYVVFKNNPEADFNCIAWPMGLLQVSCNPFKEKALKEIHLGEIAKEVLAKHESTLKRFFVSLESIKKEFETSQDWKAMSKAEGDDYEGVGFKFSDLEAFYKDCLFEKKDNNVVNVDINDPKLKSNMNTLFEDLTSDQKVYLSNIKIPAWELIIRNSGGHPSITNITGLNFLKYNKAALKIAYKTEKYVDVLKTLAKDFVNVLKTKIDIAKEGGQVEYDTKGVELLGQDTNENFDYQIVDKVSGQPVSVTKDQFLKAGASKGMKTDRKSLMSIDMVNKKVVAKFEKFNIKK
jgi:lipoate-protein ligase A